MQDPRPEINVALATLRSLKPIAIFSKVPEQYSQEAVERMIGHCIGLLKIAHGLAEETTWAS